MKSSLEMGMLAFVLAGVASGAFGQEDCGQRITELSTIGDVKGALSCVDRHIVTESDRIRKEAANNKTQLDQKISSLKVATTSVRSVALKDVTNGKWKQIPDSDAAAACYLSAVRLPPQGVCQVGYQGEEERWAFNVSNPAGMDFICTATCVWTDIIHKPPADSP